MFGDGGSVTARMEQMRKDRSILDSVTQSFARLEKRLGASDRHSVSDYLEAVREVERRIQKAEQNNADAPLPTVVQPAGVPEEYDEHAKILLDLLVLGYQADITRVSCMQIARESSTRTYPWIGVPEPHHPMSHHQNDPHNIQQKTKIDTYHMSLFARLVEKMAQSQDGDGSLLDHTIFVYGAGMGDGDHHTPIDLPIVLVGGGCGQLQGGRHLKYELNTPFMNLGVTLLDKLGVRVDSIADSTGRLANL
jgi:hypothetical protein